MRGLAGGASQQQDRHARGLPHAQSQNARAGMRMPTPLMPVVSEADYGGIREPVDDSWFGESEFTLHSTLSYSRSTDLRTSP